MPKKIRVSYIPGKVRGQKGSLVIRDRAGALLGKLPVKPTFDPTTVFFEAYCCKGTLGDCKKRAAGANCADTDRPITVWQ